MRIAMFGTVLAIRGGIKSTKELVTMFSTKIDVTPELATDILAHRNRTGRPLSRDRVRRYLTEIQEGRFDGDNPQGVSFDGPDPETANLIDGQHRLTAIKLSGKTVELYAHFEVPPNAIQVMDQGLTRTATQGAAVLLAESQFEPEYRASRLTPAARITLELGYKHPKPSNSLVTQFLMKNLRVLDAYGGLNKPYKAGTHAAFVFAELSGMRGVREAAHRLEEMDWNSDEDPMRALARALAGIQGQGARAQRTQFFTSLAALEYVDRGEGLLIARKYGDMPTRVDSSIRMRSSIPTSSVLEVSHG